jgi:hypothetical protein
MKVDKFLQCPGIVSASGAVGREIESRQGMRW